MPVDVANFVNRNYRAVRPAEVERDRYSNALMREQVETAPLRRQAMEQGLAAGAQNLSQGATAFSEQQKANARGILARGFMSIAESAQPKARAQQFLQSPDFQTAGKMLGIPIDQFSVTAQDTDDLIRSQSMDWGRYLGGEERLGNQAKPSALVEQYELYRAQGGTLPFVDPTNRGRDFVTQFSRSQVGAQYGAPTDVPGVGVVVPSRTTGALGVVSPEAAVSTAEADRSAQRTTSEEQAKAAVERQSQAMLSQRTYDMWGASRDYLLEALGATTTGPGAGLIPPVTANQQIAQGAIAAIAPVLKQIFRVAGEGVFTDRDQALLLEMVPSRNDLPQAVAAKMRNIDQIVQQKLGVAQGGQPQATPSANSGSTAPEGTIIEGNGRRLIKRNGQWVPL